MSYPVGMQDRQPAYPRSLNHRHGLDEWSPMLPERSAEVIKPGQAPPARIYRCQRIGCTEMVSVDAHDVVSEPVAGASDPA